MAGTNGRTNGAVIPPFAQLDVQSAYSAGASPSSPDDFVRALVRQYPLDEASDQAPKLAIALADTGLVDRWAYILQDMPKEGPPTIWKWEGWQKYGNIMLAPHRTQMGNDRKLELSDIAVMDQLTR